MHPILIQIGPFTVYSYGAMLALAVVTCGFLLSRDAVKHGIARDAVHDLVFWVILWGIVAARIYYVMITWDYFAAVPLEIFMINKGGLAWQGGLLGGALAGMGFARARHLSLRLLLDLSAPYLALGQAIGRIGCFLNGCCYGKPPHPAQLYEMAALFVVFLILKYIQKRPLASGMLFAIYLWLVAIERFIVEFYRADHTILAAGLSQAQFVSLGVFAVGVFVYLRSKR